MNDDLPHGIGLLTGKELGKQGQTAPTGGWAVDDFGYVFYELEFEFMEPYTGAVTGTRSSEPDQLGSGPSDLRMDMLRDPLTKPQTIELWREPFGGARGGLDQRLNVIRAGLDPRRSPFGRASFVGDKSEGLVRMDFDPQKTGFPACLVLVTGGKIESTPGLNTRSLLTGPSFDSAWVEPSCTSRSLPSLEIRLPLYGHVEVFVSGTGSSDPAEISYFPDHTARQAWVTEVNEISGCHVDDMELEDQTWS